MSSYDIANEVYPKIQQTGLRWRIVDFEQDKRIINSNVKQVLEKSFCTISGYYKLKDLSGSIIWSSLSAYIPTSSV